jgi:nucleoside-diphosphate-sugar epimerase
MKRELAMVRGELPLNYVHVDDAANAFVVAAQRLLSGQVAGLEVFAVRSPERITVRELFEIWEQARGVRLAARWGERPYRPREVLEHWTQGSALPGWSPAISLSDGLKGL